MITCTGLPPGLLMTDCVCGKLETWLVLVAPVYHMLVVVLGVRNMLVLVLVVYWDKVLDSSLVFELD